MYLDRNGNEVPPPMKNIVECNKELESKYVVRLILDEGWRKRVIAEEEFDDSPNENQIKWCLSQYRQASFAVIEKIYRFKIDKEELPFH